MRGSVHDGSTGDLAIGYWLLAVEARQTTDARQGIYLSEWSAPSVTFSQSRPENGKVLSRLV
jgi:hypothetical protein